MIRATHALEVWFFNTLMQTMIIAWTTRCHVGFLNIQYDCLLINNDPTAVVALDQLLAEAVLSKSGLEHNTPLQIIRCLTNQATRHAYPADSPIFCPQTAQIHPSVVFDGLYLQLLSLKQDLGFRLAGGGQEASGDVPAERSTFLVRGRLQLTHCRCEHRWPRAVPAFPTCPWSHGSCAGARYLTPNPFSTSVECFALTW